MRNKVDFDGGSSKYSSGSAVDVRQHLTTDHGWKLSDGGQLPE